MQQQFRKKKERVRLLILCSAFWFFLLTNHSNAISSEKIALGNSCSYFGEPLPSSVYLFTSDRSAESVIDDILNVSGLPRNFEVKAAGVPNASAVIIGNDRYILYNQNFVRSLKDATNSDWSSYLVMAHEIGHHLAGHTLKSTGSRPSIELEADKYAGFTLQRLGASLANSLIGMKVLAPDRATLTHPAKNDRIAAISNGWISSCEGDVNCKINVTESKATLPIVIPSPEPSRHSRFKLTRSETSKYEDAKFAINQMIAETQSRLNLYGCQTGTVDGLWGPSTKKAIDRYIKAAEPIGRNGIRSLVGGVERSHQKSLDAITAKVFVSGYLQMRSYSGRLRDNINLFGNNLIQDGSYRCYGNPPVYTTEMRKQDIEWRKQRSTR